jgi:glycosyltransferase involved in cell wall biosynthesis
MSSIAILRIPPSSSDRDASSKDIQNIISITSDIVGSAMVFEEKFSQTEATINDVSRRHSSNLFISAIYLFLYQLEITKCLYRERDNLEAVFLHAGGFSFVLPIIYCKIDGIAVIISVIGEPHKGYKNASSESFTDRIQVQVVLYAEKFAYAMADAITVFSEDMLSYGPISEYEFKCKRVQFNFEPVPDEIPGITNRSTSIVYLGRICELKGADRVFNVVEHLATEHDYKVSTLFVGDGNLLEPLLQRRDEQGFNFIEFTGWVDSATVSEILSDSQILLLPSRSEGLPKSLLEAMARGTVPVVTPVGDINSVVEDGTNGFIITEPECEYIAEKIIELLNSDNLQTISNNARQTISQEYGYERAKSEFKELLEMCTG